MKLRKMSKTTIALVLIVSMLSVALVYAVLYTLEIPNTMRLQTTYGLKLETGNAVPITSYDWSDFVASETKQMAKDISDNLMLINVGNTAVNVTWVANVPSGWSLTVNNLSDGVVWNSGDIISMELSGDSSRIALTILLTEISAVAGQDYSFSLDFQVVE